jgi:hypothetical protein
MNLLPLVVAGMLWCLCLPAHSESTIFDAFDAGEFNLAHNGTLFDVENGQFPFVNRRRVTGNGNPEWRASLDASIGILRYEVEPRVPPNELTHLVLDYRNANSALFNIADYEAFELQIPELTGSGYLRVTVNGMLTTNSLPELITQPGVLYYPFANMVQHAYENPVISVQFYFFALNGDFSVGVDQIAVVPEPTSVFLLMSATVMFAMRRSRH